MTTKQGCETAARELGLSDTTANEVAYPWRTPYCYYLYGSSLYFNAAFNSTEPCSDRDQCICKLPKRRSLLFYIYFGSGRYEQKEHYVIYDFNREVPREAKEIVAKSRFKVKIRF